MKNKKALKQNVITYGMVIASLGSDPDHDEDW